MIKITAVSYLNTFPFIWGINQKLDIPYQLILNYPAKCAENIFEEKADIGLVPVGALPKIKNFKIITDYCLGADGAVETVCLFSNVPLKQIKTIYLDYQSMTSVRLVQVLAKEYWNISPEFLQAKKGFENNILGNNSASVIIGDRTFDIKNNYSFVYDLSAEWKKYTALPFVFAVWVTTKELEKKTIEKLNAALKYGTEKTKKVISHYKSISPVSENAMSDYYQNKISYHFDNKKQLALKTFLKQIKNKM